MGVVASSPGPSLALIVVTIFSTKKGENNLTPSKRNKEEGGLLKCITRDIS